MSCNPSIGGVGKGHLVRELDVFDGLMARAADRAAIHRRMLNRSKGPAVHGPARPGRPALVSRARSQRFARRQRGRDLRRPRPCGCCRGWACHRGRDQRRPALDCRALVIATGTFLDATNLFVGEERIAGGRTGERAASVALAEQVRDIGLGQGRLKTGTPPRLDGRTIDWARLEEQPSDAEPLDDVGDRRRRVGRRSCAARSRGPTTARTS